MAIDSNIALGVKPIQIDSPLNSLAQLYQLKNAQSQGQMNDLNMQERTRSIEDSNKLRDLYAQPGFDMSSPDSMRKVMGISPSQGMAIQKSQLDNRKTQSEIDKISFDTASKSHSIYQNTLGALAYSPNLTKDAVVQAGQGLVQAGVLKPEVLQQQLAGLSDDPIALKAQLLQGVHAQLTPDELLKAFAPKPTQMDNGQSISFRDTNPNSPTYGQMTGGAPVMKMQSPESIASNNTTMRGQNMSSATAAAGRAQSAQQFGVTQAAGKVPSGYRAAADGSMVFIPGGPADPNSGTKTPTEFQGKSATFGARAEQADKIISSLDGKYSPSAINSKMSMEATAGVGGVLGAAANKFILSSEDQRAEQAQRDFINAVLRQESGAAIAPSEFQNAAKQYFTQPGDGPAVIKQKAEDRKLAIQGFKNSAGKAAFSKAASEVPGDIHTQADAILKGN
jgi:hypothetical protein